MAPKVAPPAKTPAKDAPTKGVAAKAPVAPSPAKTPTAPATKATSTPAKGAIPKHPPKADDMKVGGTVLDAILRPKMAAEGDDSIFLP